MHIDGAGTRVFAAQDVARAGGGHQRALRGLGAKALGCHGDFAAQGNAVFILEHVTHVRQRLGASGHGDGVLGGEPLHAAMAQCGNAVHPFEHGGHMVEHIGHRRRAHARKPQRVVGGKVGHTGLHAKQKIVLFNHVRDAPQVGAVGGRGILRAQARHVHAHGLAVFGKGCPGLGRQLGEQRGHALGLHVVGHGRPEQGAVGPLGKHAGDALQVRWIEHGFGLLVLQHLTNQAGVAVNVGADLQDGRAPVTTRERHHIGLGHDAGDDDRLPGQLLEAQHKANLFGKRRRGVVVQDEFCAHGVSLESAGSAGRSISMWGIPSSR